MGYLSGKLSARAEHSAIIHLQHNNFTLVTVAMVNAKNKPFPAAQGSSATINLPTARETVHLAADFGWQQHN